MIGLDDILAGLNIFEKIAKLGDWIGAKRHAESVATRFVRLFESHGVHRNQIPRFFGHGLALRDVHDDAALLAKLDEYTLDQACQLFAVRREWLDGAQETIFPTHDFYKHPEDALDFVRALKDRNPEGQLGGVLIAPRESENDAEALLVLDEVIGSVGEKPIYRYHLCNNWIFSYWKARAYLTACVAIAWNQRVFIHGTHMPNKEIARLARGESFLGAHGEGASAFGLKTWDPEDMALRPDVFLQGVDAEENFFGIASALREWLRLEQEGYMRTGLGMYEPADIRQRFESEFAKHEKREAVRMRLFQ